MPTRSYAYGFHTTSPVRRYTTEYLPTFEHHLMRHPKRIGWWENKN
ncbi:hypothetical protein [Nostoc sp. WHI]|nr:hypothetical protein [Nostoc sp. WHI]